MFKYKGIRIRRFHRDIVFIYLSLMSLPFALLSISFLYLVYARSPDKLICAAFAAAFFAFGVQKKRRSQWLLYSSKTPPAVSQNDY